MKSQATTWWETASHDEITHRQNTLLKRFLRERAVPFTAYYRELFHRHSLDARDINGTGDLPKIPFTTKAQLTTPRDFVIIPDEAVLKRQWSTLRLAITHGPNAAKELLEKELRPIFLTSTTGRSAAPVPFVYTQHDIANLTEGGRRLMELCRADASWRHINAFPFAPHLAFWQGHYASIGFDTFMLATGGGKSLGTDGNIRVISQIDPDTIIAMPTFLYHLLQKATSEGMQWKKVKRLVLGGEKVPAGMRRKLRSLCAEMGAREVAIMSTYGFTEAKIAFTECMPPEGEPPSGFHIYPDKVFIEVIDPKTGNRVPDGQPGEIVYTPLDSRGTIVLRYRTGDIIEKGITYEPCPYCGRTCPRLLGNISRVSDVKELNIDKLKGTLVDFSSLENLLDDADGLGAWQIELKKRNDDPLESDQIIVHAVAMHDHEAALRGQIEQRFNQATELSPNDIVFHTWDEMRALQGVGKELKEKKLVDHRPVET
ncbi:MAG: AMP-binding protein [Luteolibacter sp.]